MLAASLLAHGSQIYGDRDFTAYLGPLGYTLWRQGRRQEGIEMMETVVGRLRDSGDLDERNSALERIEAIRNEMSGSIDADILHCPQGLENNLGPFRRTFLAVYPRFVDDLRRDYPSLTDTDMVFCMLIFLQHSTQEISASLNISRASVNSARYWLRSKLRLAKEESLDKFLQSRQG